MALFRKQILRTGGAADPVSGGRVQITPDMLADIRRSWRPGIPVCLADGHNRWNASQVCGEVTSLEREGNVIYACLDLSDEVSAGIRDGIVLGASAVIDPAADTLRGVLITNRPPQVDLEGYTIAASYDEDEQLVTLSATTQEPYVSVLDQYTGAYPVAPEDDGFLDPAPAWSVEDECNRIVAACAPSAGQQMFGMANYGPRRSVTFQGTEAPARVISGDITTADLDGAVAELAELAGVMPHAIEDQLAALSSSAVLTVDEKIVAIGRLAARLASDDPSLIGLSAGGAALADAEQSEIVRLTSDPENGKYFALAWPVSQQGPGARHNQRTTAPRLDGGSPPHAPFFGVHEHVHDHGSVIRHGPVGRRHSHLHSHGEDGVEDAQHADNHPVAQETWGNPQQDIDQLPGELGDTPGAMEVARILTDSHNREFFANGQVKGQSYVSTEPADELDTDSRQPAKGHVMHPDVVDMILRRSGQEAGLEPPRPAAGITPPADTELRNYQARRALGPLGKEGAAVPWRGPGARNNPSGDRGSTRPARRAAVRP
jgi:hypothetical protein